VPQRILLHEELPLNGSGKVDRLALKEISEAESGDAGATGARGAT
jgi:acyl-coenzyme A synthetase/AMP-(fatty) acid ligase